MAPSAFSRAISCLITRQWTDQTENTPTDAAARPAPGHATASIDLVFPKQTAFLVGGGRQ